MKLLFLFLILLGSLLWNVEGFTSCDNLNSTHNPPYTCSDCINAPINGAGYPCYWNSTTKNCSSFQDKGYSKSCPFF